MGLKIAARKGLDDIVVHRMIHWSQQSVGDEYASEGHVHTWSEPSTRVRSRKSKRKDRQTSNVTSSVPVSPMTTGTSHHQFSKTRSAPILPPVTAGCLPHRTESLAPSCSDQ